MSQLVRVGTNLLPIDSSNSDGFILKRSAAHTPIDTVFSKYMGSMGIEAKAIYPTFDAFRIQS